MSADFLDTMTASSRERVALARHTLPDAALMQAALASPLPPRLQLSSRGFDVFAEVKLRSPAMGQLRATDENVAARVVEYAAAGAAAISVLTEPSRFDGSMKHLKLAVTALAGRAPVMRKDFLVDPYQVMEARAAGAGGVLVILRMLPIEGSAALLDMAVRMKLFVLLEAFDAVDLEVAATLLRTHAAATVTAQAPLLVGINCRDLATLQVVPGRLEALASSLPANAPRVAESGVESAQDVDRLARAGYTCALVGGALMKSGDAGAAVHALLEAGRSVRSGLT